MQVCRGYKLIWMMSVWLGVIFPLSLWANTPDVRILIDVSGSMKDNDPDNLRVPSLRLLSGLMPADSTSGVWLFATNAERIIAAQNVTPKWRETTYQAANKIHNRGQFTDIEKALNAVIQSVSTNTSDQQRNIILLSDGMIDLQRGQQANQQSRQRILDNLLPRLKTLGFEVHTIALSEQADKDLLKQLSVETNGWFHQVATADELERIFLHLFEQASPVDSVPLNDNHFSIDTSVSEMTVVVFREAGSSPASLVQPDQQVIDYSMRDDQIRWHHEHHYDLITITKPMAGDWFIDAAIDPDNRVLVVTDLRIETNDLPNNILVGERFDIEAYLTEHNQRIEHEDFLQMVSIELVQQTATGDTREQSLSRHRDQPVYRTELGDLFQVGRNDIVITARSETFERQRRQSVNLIAVPLRIETMQLEGASRTHQLNIFADDYLLETDSLAVFALLRSPEGIEYPYEAVRQQDNLWQLTLTDLQPELAYRLSLQIRGYTPQGRPVFLQPEVLDITDQYAKTQLTDNVSVVTPITDIADNLSTNEQTGKIFGLTRTEAVILLIGNAIFLLLLLTGWWFWRHQQRRPQLTGDLI